MELSNYAQEIIESRYLWENEKTWNDLVDRVSRECAKNEQKDQEKWYEAFKYAIGNMYFIPAGRILRNLGKLRPSTSNCNVLSIEDNIESIGETLKNFLIIASHGGGTGINFSPLRPKGAPLKTKGGFSSGLVSFIEMFNNCGERIETGGSRRGAGIALCDISHPEVIDFINAKIKHNKLNQFNISVIINTSFIKAVENNEDWEFKFVGKSYGKTRAREIWNLILKNMLEHSEPGLINWDNLKKNNSYYFSPITCVNPCGEVGLGNLETCNLASLVLPFFISNKNTNWQKLSETIKTIVRFLDNIIDLSYYPIVGQEIAVKNARRIGVGTMGLADFLFIKEIRYGSDRSINEIERLYKFIRDEVYIASIELAIERGTFPKYNRSDYTDASFIKKLPPKIRMMIKDHGIRHVSSLSCQPTGTSSLIPGVVGGIEPLPYKGYIRKDGVGERIYVHPLNKTSANEEWFVDSYDLKPEEHLDVQSVIQKYTDGGISKTILVPADTTEKKLSKILLEFINDIKGCTLYRDESREKQVYYRMSDKEIKDYLNTAETELDATDVDCKDGTCDI